MQEAGLDGDVEVRASHANVPDSHRTGVEHGAVVHEVGWQGTGAVDQIEQSIVGDEATAGAGFNVIDG